MAGEIPSVNEGTTHVIALDFLDEDGGAILPSSVTYRIDCLTSRTEIVPDTVLPADAMSELEVSGAAAAIVNPRHRREARRVTAVAEYDEGAKQITEEWDYEILNLSGL